MSMSLAHWAYGHNPLVCGFLEKIDFERHGPHGYDPAPYEKPEVEWL